MPPVIRQIAYASKDYDVAVRLRRAILRTPLGLDFTPEQLAAESGDTFLAAFDGDVLIGTLVLTPYDAQTVKLRQMAVADGHQGLAIGSKLLKAAEQTAHAMGATAISLAARVTAQAFYEKNGYVAEGDTFTEVTLPHIKMHKQL